MLRLFLLFSFNLLASVRVLGDGSAVVPELASGDSANGSRYHISSDTNHTNSDDHHGSHHGGLHVAAVAYGEVRDPLIFTIVVLLAGISKIGKEGGGVSHVCVCF